MKTPFKLKSGNTSSFKNMGSSPVKQRIEDLPTSPKGHKVGTFNKADVRFIKRKPGKFVKHKLRQKPLSAKGLKQKEALQKVGKAVKKSIGKIGKFLGGKTLGVAGMLSAKTSKADQPGVGKHGGGKAKLTKPDFKGISKDLQKAMYKPLKK